MQHKIHHLKNKLVLMIRKANGEDAGAVLTFLESVSGETDFLSFGPGQFGLTKEEEKKFLRKRHDSTNEICLLGLIDGDIVSVLNFAGGPRPRVQHRGELGLSVRKNYWGSGIGALMLDTVIDWAKRTDIVKKINLRVRPDNQRALALYQRKGFIIEGTIRREMYMNGKYYDHHYMGLEL